MAAKKKAAKKPSEETALAPTGSDLPAYMQSGNADEGFEGMRGQDVEFPRVRLIQRTSPEIDEGIKPGTLLNHMTGDLLADQGEKISFHIVLHYLSWIEWVPISEGGGIISASMDPQSQLAARATRGEKARGTEKPAVTEYHNFVIVIPTLGLDQPLLLSFSKTNYKHGRRLLNLARHRKASIYAGGYTFCTVSKTKGDYKWHEIECQNDNENAWADEETFKVLQLLHEEYAPLMRAGAIDVVGGLDDAPASGETVAQAGDADVEY